MPENIVQTLPAVSHCWTCECGTELRRYRGARGDVQCPNCDAEYNAFGQKLRSGWSANLSSWDEEISDLDGYEAASAGDA